MPDPDLAESLDRILPEAKSLELLEAGASQVSPTDELAGGSAFCYVGPTQKSDHLTTMCWIDWEGSTFLYWRAAGVKCAEGETAMAEYQLMDWRYFSAI
ncbi:hypothetical protein HO133_001109 [Letharia lupina]|uniref:Uncharacterized protein n=1 Tax=Letharia lupina TaxID=560253 RepID=A0A8H6FC65_9LECA|nr:uncharacterized protein HO133_001109 [Letharia lupina]KAF6223057.1 hypothetical protein HO133_001109 [Letharia lupina]